MHARRLRCRHRASALLTRRCHAPTVSRGSHTNEPFASCTPHDRPVEQHSALLVRSVSRISPRCPHRRTCSMRSRRTRLLLPLAAAGVIGLVVASLPALASCQQPRAPPRATASPPASLKLQDEFDHIGAEVHSLTQRRAHLVLHRRGHPADHPVVFIGGASTSLEAFQLTEFARTTREQLGRADHLGRAQRPRRVAAGPRASATTDYNPEVLAVLDHLGVDASRSWPSPAAAPTPRSWPPRSRTA